MGIRCPSTVYKNHSSSFSICQNLIKFARNENSVLTNILQTGFLCVIDGTSAGGGTQCSHYSCPQHGRCVTAHYCLHLVALLKAVVQRLCTLPPSVYQYEQTLDSSKSRDCGVKQHPSWACSTADAQQATWWKTGYTGDGSTSHSFRGNVASGAERSCLIGRVWMHRL